VIGNVMSTGLSGIRSGLSGLAQNAAAIASARQQDGGKDGNIIEPIVGEAVNVNQVEASAKVLKSADVTIGALIDVTA
jgi:hypothetical protein